MFDFGLGASLIGFVAAFFVPVYGLVGMILAAAVGGSVLAASGGAPLPQILARCLLSVVFVQVGYALGLFTRAGFIRKNIGYIDPRLRLRAAIDARKKR